MTQLPLTHVTWVVSWLLIASGVTHGAILTTAEQQEIVNLHNTLRHGEGSSNMQMLVSRR